MSNDFNKIDKEFDEKFENTTIIEDGINPAYIAFENGMFSLDSFIYEIKSFLHQKLLERDGERDYKLLESYSDWLHKEGYIDADYYTEEPHAVDAFIESKNYQSLINEMKK